MRLPIAGALSGFINSISATIRQAVRYAVMVPVYGIAAGVHGRVVEVDVDARVSFPHLIGPGGVVVETNQIGCSAASIHKRAVSGLILVAEPTGLPIECFQG